MDLMPSDRPRRAPPFAWPYPPFLGFAPLDVWFRLLFWPRPVIPLRYWPRVAIGLLLSAAITVLTLPERLALALYLRLCGHALDRRPAPVFILGYYRSGTTFLQFLLNCDPNLYSPRWCQTFSPQGFFLSWTFLRFFLTPFYSTARPQDDVAFGPDVPAEDDFALCNGALVSSLVGRHVLPRLRDVYDRFHDLKRLTPPEFSRWRRCQLGFIRKLAILAGRRRILLKTPSHTARVEELIELFAASADGPRFIHISREPQAVVRSNLGLHRALNPILHLQDAISDEEQERRTVAEYLATEQSYLAARSRIPVGWLAEIRLEDLRADPIGELRRVYTELGMPFTEAFGRRAAEYLDVSRDYKPNAHPPGDAERLRRLEAQLAPLAKAFHHDEPAIPKVVSLPPAYMAPGPRRVRLITAVLFASLTGLLCTAGWLALVLLAGRRLDQLVWPAGIALGLVTLHVARRGSSWLGLWAALLAVLTQLGAALLTTWLLAHPAGSDFSQLAWTTAEALGSINVLFWTFMGAATAYRLASKPFIY
jgi:omega-hydroxy-beta-dihydromenaquinone-9 sulfotransferase